MYYMGSQAAPRVSQGGIADGVILIGLIVFGLVWSNHNAETVGAENFLCVGICSGMKSESMNTVKGEDNTAQPLDVYISTPEGHEMSVKRNNNKITTTNEK